jgi:hypothetical protein
MVTQYVIRTPNENVRSDFKAFELSKDCAVLCAIYFIPCEQGPVVMMFGFSLGAAVPIKKPLQFLI